VIRLEWPSFVLNCPNLAMGWDASKEAFHLMDGKVVIWDPEIFFPVLLSIKLWIACVKWISPWDSAGSVDDSQGGEGANEQLLCYSASTSIKGV